MHFEFKPEDENIEGKIVLNSLSVSERLDMGSQFFDAIDEVGGVDKLKTQTNITMLKQYIKLAKDHIVSVDLKSKKPEKVYKSYDELEDDQEAHHIIIEMANFYSTRIDLGNLLGRKSKGKSAPTTEATT